MLDFESILISRNVVSPAKRGEVLRPEARYANQRRRAWKASDRKRALRKNVEM
jgi:hypothetical protein